MAKQRRNLSVVQRAALGAVAIVIGTLAVPTAGAQARIADEAKNCAAGQIILDAKRIDLMVMKQDVKATLELMGQASGVQIVIGRKLQGDMKQVDLRGTLREALTKLATHNNAVWWWSGSAVRFVPKTTTVTRSIQFPSVRELVDTARDLCLPVGALTYHTSNDEQYARVSGPAEVVSELEKLAKTLRARYANVKQLRYGQASRKSLMAK